MNLFNHQLRERHQESGQTLLMFVLFMVVLFVFVGFGIDVGFAYITKAQLSKAVDAACLAGVRNLFQGDDQARAVATATFAANYGTPGRDVTTVVPVVNITTDASNNRVIDVSATATINTFFIRVMPAIGGANFSTLQVKADAQATRAKLVMTLVLDRSGSMSLNGGATALPPAVKTFIGYFDDNLDQVAMASFASHARLDVPMGKPFKTAIRNAADAMNFNGATFAQGGLTNALVQNQSVVVVSGENVVKVTVFFTDGIANTIQDRLNCPPATLYNFGGNAPSEGTYIGFFNPSTGNTDCGDNGSTPTNAITPSCCSGSTGFTSAIDGTFKSFTRANITADAEYRSVQVADDMRAQNMIVYSIGLGNNINRGFLHQIANDESSPTYDPNLLVGMAAFAPTPSDLEGVFQTIAAKILMRLTR